MYLISTSYKLVLVCIVTISVLNTIKCIDIPSTDFLPPFTSIETHSNNIDDDTYLTLSSSTTTSKPSVTITTIKSTIKPSVITTPKSVRIPSKTTTIIKSTIKPFVITKRPATSKPKIKSKRPEKQSEFSKISSSRKIPTTIQPKTILSKRITLPSRSIASKIQTTTSPPPQTEPSSTKPPPTQPIPTKPAPTQPAPTQPRPTQPRPTQPRPTQPTLIPPAPKISSKLHQRSSISSKSTSSTRFNNNNDANSVSNSNSKVHQQTENIALGIYEYHFDTDNGIHVEENGHPKDLGNGQLAEDISGSYSYTAPNGEIIKLEYTADETGFHPTGEHLPTAPPIPEAILRALKYIEEHGIRQK